MRAYQFITENSWKERYSSPWEVLGLQPGASREEITSAYRKLASKYHPDRVSPDQKDQATKMMQYINDARKSIEQGDTATQTPTQPQSQAQPKRSAPQAEKAWTREDYAEYGKRVARENMIFPDRFALLSKENLSAMIDGYLSVTDIKSNRENEKFIRKVMPQAKQSVGDKLSGFARRAFGF